MKMGGSFTLFTIEDELADRGIKEVKKLIL